MKKIVLLVLAIVALIACDDKKTENAVQKEVYVSGKITAVDSIAIPEQLKAYVYNDLKADYDEIEVAVDADGSFSTTIPLEKTRSFALYGDFGTQLVASPGDSITIMTDARFKNTTYGGNAGAANKAMEQYTKNNPAAELLEGKDALSPQEYAASLESALSAIKSYNADFLAKNDFPVVKAYVNSEEEFFIPSKKITYALFNPQGPAAFQDSTFLESLNNLPEYKELYDINNSNPTTTLNYIGYIWERDAIEDNDLAREEAYMKRWNSLENNPYLKKKIMQSKVMNQFEDNNISFYENNKEQISEMFDGTVMGSTFSSKYDEVKKLLDNPEVPEDAELLTFKSEDSAQFIDEIIANANGKVIYIDNWATWCGPCKSEFKKASPELHEKFKDDVEFVYLCHNSKEKNYLPSIAKYQIAGKHYFLTNEQSRPIFKQIDLEGFPTYTIINKKGEIVLSDYIHRPSYAKTTDILTGLINEEI
ncbi:MAG: TlpA family protein disulfide reductase [Nonlabens sp.]|uniref:TlpA family protein disulfide reductase n=1 Tax=Nonlabens sp. TaxID=1888209 RepID=UPI003EF8537D